MHVIHARNVHNALIFGLDYLFTHGVQRDSRNGPVLQSPMPVTTVYWNPLERVVFWPERDANPFFHLYESLWMLTGRNDVASVARYAKQMEAYSDDGRTLHGAYGHRWRQAFVMEKLSWDAESDTDQLLLIAETLRKNRDDRRCVLQMWSPRTDLGRDGKDLPCNLTATFQVGTDNCLHLTVFCRSNDIVWGAYGANAVHMAFLLEYMALITGYPVGTYSQISVNYHGYLSTIEPLHDLVVAQSALYATPRHYDNPYRDGDVQTLQMARPNAPVEQPHLDDQINAVLYDEAKGFDGAISALWPTFHIIREILRAHHVYKTSPTPQRFMESLEILSRIDDGGKEYDWVRAAREWILRRYAKRKDKD